MKLTTKNILTALATILTLGFKIAGAAECSRPYEIGDPGPDGGIVYHVDGSGCHGLEAQVADYAEKLNWSDAIAASASYNNSANPITGTAGFNCGTVYAQYTPYCWHLPTKSELELLYESGIVKQQGYDPGGTEHWSGTEKATNSKLAWAEDFYYSGQQGRYNKGLRMRFRAVREFY